MGAAPIESTEIDGRRLAWRTAGEGPPLLLINGYAATSEDWDPGFLDGLAASFRVISPDNRGVGGSELGAAELTVDGMAADLEALLGVLGIERATVVGWSMGGFVAQRLAVRAGDRIAALALLATDPGGPDSVLAEPEAWSRLVDLSGTPREQASRLISLLFPPPLAADIERQFGDVVAAARAGLAPATLRAQEDAMASWHRESPSREGAVAPLPVLVAHGDLDEVIPPSNVEAVAARWPGAQVKRFEGCGHALMAQEPGRIADLITHLARFRQADAMPEEGLEPPTRGL